jgi:hypothetical protein
LNENTKLISDSLSYKTTKISSFDITSDMRLVICDCGCRLMLLTTTTKATRLLKRSADADCCTALRKASCQVRKSEMDTARGMHVGKKKCIETLGGKVEGKARLG